MGTRRWFRRNLHPLASARGDVVCLNSAQEDWMDVTEIREETNALRRRAAVGFAVLDVVCSKFLKRGKAVVVTPSSIFLRLLSRINAQQLSWRNPWCVCVCAELCDESRA